MNKIANKLRIMLVDDDMDVLPLYEMIGEVEDTLFTVQKGGLSALKMLHDINYEMDAVILDLSMPDMDGLTLTNQIRTNEALRSKPTPIEIFWFTGWPMNETLLNAKDKYNVREIFTKPILPTELIHEVKMRIQ